MNILLMSYSFLPTVGGVERSVFNLATHLIDQGHRVTLVTHIKTAFAVRMSRHESIPVVRLHMPSPFHQQWRRRAFSALATLTNLVVLIGLCVVKRIQVIHCHYLNIDAYYAPRVARLLNIPFVLTLRGGETEQWIVGRPPRRRFVADILRSAHHVTAVSRSLLRHADTLAPGVLKKSTRIANPVTRAHVLASLGRCVVEDAPARPYILFVGRLAPMKDIATLIEAYHLTLHEQSSFNADLVIVGAGPEEAALKRRAVDGDGRDRIRFLGARPYAQTLCLVKDAQVLILPSARSEGCPNAVLEAMALETPVVVSDLPALTELVEDGVNGLVFRIGDAAGLKGRLVELIGDRQRRADLTDAAAKRLAAQHTFDAVREQYLRVYRNLHTRPRSCRLTDTKQHPVSLRSRCGFY
jgi:glycosyltransferase involved in cell wall biosynthesis